MTLACLLPMLLVLTSGSVASEIGGTSSSDNPSSTTRAVAGGALLGTLGFTAGFLVGVSMESSSSNEYAGLEYGFVVGSVVGGIMLPLGVHAGNHGRGNPWLVVGTSLAVGAAGWALAFTFDKAFLLPVTAVGQLVACTAVEMGTSPDPEPAGLASLAIGPARIDGKPGLVCAFSF